VEQHYGQNLFYISNLVVQHSYEQFGGHAVEVVIFQQEKTHHNAGAVWCMLRWKSWFDTKK